MPDFDILISNILLFWKNSKNYKIEAFVEDGIVWYGIKDLSGGLEYSKTAKLKLQRITMDKSNLS